MGIENKNLFDKFIDVSFFTDSNSAGTFERGEIVNAQGTDDIITPKTGRKPQIAVSGMLFGNNNIQNIELRITNFYTSKSLTDYKTVKIKAGYKNGQHAAFEGEIFSSYVDKPPPDSETVFNVMIGSAGAYFNQNVNDNYTSKGMTLSTMLSSIANRMGTYGGQQISVKYLPESFQATVSSYQLPCDFSFNAPVADCIKKIENAFQNKIRVRPEGNVLYIYDPKQGTGVTHQIDYIVSARNDIGIFTIVAPWIPKVRPGDKIQANPQYFYQQQGGQFIGTNIFQVAMVEFNFDTCEDTNQMSLVCIPDRKEWL